MEVEAHCVARMHIRWQQIECTSEDRDGGVKVERSYYGKGQVLLGFDRYQLMHPELGVEEPLLIISCARAYLSARYETE